MRRNGRPWWLLLLIAAPTLAGAEDAKPRPLARYFPRRDLAAYVEFDGIDAHAGPWRKTAAARVLVETPVGTMLAKVATQALDMILPFGGEEGPTSAEVAEVASILVRSGFAFAINRKAGDPKAKPSCIGLVVRGAGRDSVVATWKKVLGVLQIPEEGMESVPKPGGRTLTRVGPAEGPGLAWWVEKGDLAFALLKPDHADAMIATLDGREPDAVDHPSRVDLAAPVEGFETVGLAFFDPAALPEPPPEALAFGLDRIRRFDVRWGYSGEALVSVTRVIAPSPRSGVLAMFDQPTFNARSLPPLPEGVGSFSAGSLELGRIYDQLVALARMAEPKGPDRFAEAAASFQEATGLRLREDVLARVGPRFVLADVPTPVFVSASPFDGLVKGLARVPRVSLLVELADRPAFLKDLDALAAWANAKYPLPKDPKAGPDRPAPQLFRRLKGVEAGYEVALSPTYWPLPAGYRPSIVVGDRFVALGTSPDVARRALQPAADLAAPLGKALAAAPGNLTALSVADARNSSLPELLANVPSMIQWWAFLIQGINVSTTTAINPAGTPPAPAPAVPAVRYRLRLDPDEVPTPDEIRPHLFPASYTMSVDAEGFRFVSRESLPALNPIALAPLAVSAALPAYQQWREKAEKDRLSANLRKVGAGLSNYQSKHGRYPPPAILGKDGRPLLSWRVAILPDLGLQSLHDEFHLDEPWDSPHNKALLERMPPAYVRPDFPAPPGSTFYRGMVDPGAFFDPALPEGVEVATITDGTSNTLAVVEAREAVPWTRPDAEFGTGRRGSDPAAFRALLGGHQPGGFQALFVDGSVRFLHDSIQPNVLMALPSRAGGEAVTGDSF